MRRHYPVQFDPYLIHVGNLKALVPFTDLYLPGMVGPELAFLLI
jgi:hypothetical protein